MYFYLAVQNLQAAGWKALVLTFVCIYFVVMNAISLLFYPFIAASLVSGNAYFVASQLGLSLPKHGT